MGCENLTSSVRKELRGAAIVRLRDRAGGLSLLNSRLTHRPKSERRNEDEE